MTPFMVKNTASASDTDVQKCSVLGLISIRRYLEDQIMPPLISRKINGPERNVLLLPEHSAERHQGKENEAGDLLFFLLPSAKLLFLVWFFGSSQ